MAGRLVYDDKTGDALWFDYDSNTVNPVDEPGLLAQAGRQFADLGSGVKMAYGEVTDQQDLVDQARAETMARNQAFAGADAAHPWQSMLGQALPVLPTAALNPGGFLQWLALNAGVGAAESGFDIGQEGSAEERAAMGALFGMGGDVVGRLAGRVLNTGRGLLNDIRLGRGSADNAVAQRAEEAGYATLGSQRAAPGTAEQRVLERLEQGAEASMFSPGLQAEVMGTNQQVLRQTVLDAVGLNADEFADMGPETLLAANARLSDGFSEVASAAAGTGPMQLPEDLASRIATTKGQIPELIKRGRFQGLEDGVMSGNEWNIARRALAADAANRAAKGEYELAEDIFADVEILDRLMEERIDPGLLEEFARLREQYRVFKVISKEGVIKPDGDISPRVLNRRLRADTGFGDTAKQGRPTTNQETGKLLQDAAILSDPSLQPFRSSGTAENLSAQRIAGMTLDPTQWLSLAGEAAMPVAAGVTSRGGSRAVTGALTPGPVQLPMIGGGAGRTFLDELFYPYVGIQDDREPR